MHRFHPDPARNDPEDAVLYDDCEDCARKADTLSGLDAHNSLKIYNRVFAWRAGHLGPVSDTESRFIRLLNGALITLAAAGVDVDPEPF